MTDRVIALGDVVAAQVRGVQLVPTFRHLCDAVQTFISGDFAAAADGGTEPSHAFDGNSRHATASDIALRMIAWT